MCQATYPSLVNIEECLCQMTSNGLWKSKTKKDDASAFLPIPTEWQENFSRHSSDTPTLSSLVLAHWNRSINQCSISDAVLLPPLANLMPNTAQRFLHWNLVLLYKNASNARHSLSMTMPEAVRKCESVGCDGTTFLRPFHRVEMETVRAH